MIMLEILGYSCLALGLILLATAGILFARYRNEQMRKAYQLQLEWCIVADKADEGYRRYLEANPGLLKYGAWIPDDVSGLLDEDEEA